VAEVTKIEIAKRPVNEAALKLVRELLEQVEKGEVTGVGIVAVEPAGEVTTAYTTGERYHYLNSGCARLAAQVASIEDGP
jgi:hypothetical protein